MATQAQVNQLKQQLQSAREEIIGTLEQIGKVRKFNEELHTKNTALEATLAALGNFKDETDKELDKANLLLKMSRNQVKQMERDTRTTRSVYNDVIEDMMNRQVMMAAAGWDEYIARKKRREEADDS